MDAASVVAELLERFSRRIVETHAHRGDHTVVVAREALVELLRACRDDHGFDMLMDLTAVDRLRFPGREDGPRFDVVYHLYGTEENRRLRVTARVDEDDASVPTAVGLWPIANWFEREVWDMFGIRFEGHPDLRRLLLYEEFVGHPLRKDYPINRRQPLIGPRI